MLPLLLLRPAATEPSVVPVAASPLKPALPPVSCCGSDTGEGRGLLAHRRRWASRWARERRRSVTTFWAAWLCPEASEWICVQRGKVVGDLRTWQLATCMVVEHSKARSYMHPGLVSNHTTASTQHPSGQETRLPRKRMVEWMRECLSQLHASRAPILLRTSPRKHMMPFKVENRAPASPSSIPTARALFDFDF